MVYVRTRQYLWLHNEVEEEEVMRTQSEVLSWYLPGGIDEDYAKPYSSQSV
jgi:hypothetical protein